MATVYRALDPSLTREVALKVMLPGFGGRADLAARFQREARALAATRDDAIVAAYEFIPARGNDPACLVGELIEGPSLRALLDEHGGRFWPEIAVLIGLRVSQALAVAHAAGIVHRDVKPDNVLVDLRPGPRARAVLSDFGVARILGAESNTTTGALLGSPAYMSPEQARGADDVGPPSDVFSLGVMLYQLVTGVLPFAGKEPVVVISSILRGEFARPGRLCARLSPELEQIIMRCLRPLPAERFSDGGALKAALEPLRASLPFGEDVQKALGEYLADARAFELRYAGRIAQAAAEEAERARKKGERPRMLTHLNRALEYDPRQPQALRLLAQVGKNQHRARWLSGAVALCLLAAGTGLTWRAVRARPPATPAIVAARTAEPVPSHIAVAVTSKPTPLPASTTLVATAPAVEDGPPRGRTGALRTDKTSDHERERVLRRERPPSASVGGPARAATIPSGALPGSAATSPAPSLGLADPAPSPASSPSSSPASSLPGSPTAAPSPVPLASEAVAVAPAVEKEKAPVENSPASPARAGLTVRAAHAFCAPSVDEGLPSLHPSFEALAAGTHVIYCTVPGKERILVGRYELRPGTHPNLIVVPDERGQPVLARPK